MKRDLRSILLMLGSGGGAYVVEGPPEQRTAITISGSGTVTAPVSGTGAVRVPVLSV